MNIQKGITQSNPNDGSDRHITVKLHATGQIVKAEVLYSIEQDRREQNPNIKTGSEVALLVDDRNNFYCFASASQGIDLEGKKIYIVENSNEVKIMTDDYFYVRAIENQHIIKSEIYTEKIKIANSAGNEIVALLSEFIQTVHDKVSIGNLGQNVYLDPATKELLLDLKSRVDTFKL